MREGEDRVNGELAGTEGTLIEQADVFFQSMEGRLKMRSLQSNGEVAVTLLLLYASKCSSLLESSRAYLVFS